MRDVKPYQITTSAAPTSRASRVRGNETATYSASGNVVTIATQRPMRAARRRRSRMQCSHSPPIGMPGVGVPQRAQG
jgi:hypothetical protein